MRFVLMGLIALVSGCATFYTPVVNMSQLQQVDFGKLDAMTRGEACENYVLIFGPFGNSSLSEAATKAGIRRVRLVEYTARWNLLTSERCTIVFGDTGGGSSKNGQTKEKG